MSKEVKGGWVVVVGRKTDDDDLRFWKKRDLRSGGEGKRLVTFSLVKSILG